MSRINLFLTCHKVKSKLMWLICFCFLCSWIPFPCLHFNNNCSISFFILFSAKDSLLLYDTFNFVLQILSKIFRPIKIKIKGFGISYYNNYSSIIIITWLNCRKLFWWFCCVDTKDSICLISFFNLFELFSAFTCTNNIGSLVNNLFGDNIFNPVPSFFLFWGFNFALSAIVSFYSNFSSSSSSNGSIGGKSSSSYYKSIGKFWIYFELLPFSSELL